jgi:hypothetical protein
VQRLVGKLPVYNQLYTLQLRISKNGSFASKSGLYKSLKLRLKVSTFKFNYIKYFYFCKAGISYKSRGSNPLAQVSRTETSALLAADNWYTYKYTNRYTGFKKEFKNSNYAMHPCMVQFLYIVL